MLISQKQCGGNMCKPLKRVIYLVLMMLVLAFQLISFVGSIGIISLLWYPVTGDNFFRLLDIADEYLIKRLEI